MTEKCYVVVRDTEILQCLEEYYTLDNKDEANGFILGLKVASKYYNDKLVRVEVNEPVEPVEEEIDRT